MERIGEAVISKVRLDAQNIVREAETRAQGEIEKAKAEREARAQQRRSKMRAEAEEEAARVLAQASIKARQRLSRAKAEAIARLVDRTRQELSRMSGDEGSLLSLVREAVAGLSADKARVFVSSRDLGTLRRALEADRELSGRVTDVRECGCQGGAIAEDVDGKLRIDNTYETRLEMLLPRLLPELSKKLFEA
jgi:V/A-type H+/Na+-transporting ATPase subunit E